MTNLFAPAKINLGLAVINKRTDDYHNLETIMIKLNIGDILEIDSSNELQLQITGANLPKNEENLAYLAAFGHNLKIKLHKNIPIGAGLGGGSSDAGAVLRFLKTIDPQIDIFSRAKSLGADVPFFLLPENAAIVHGIGEKLTPISLPKLHFVLVNPRIFVSTAEVYQSLEVKERPGLLINEIIDALQSKSEPNYRNDLEEPVLKKFPQIKKIKEMLIDYGLRGVLMSGSGSTVFGIAQNKENAGEIASELEKKHLDWWVKPASSELISDALQVRAFEPR